jgi:monoamine oxidase
MKGVAWYWSTSKRREPLKVIMAGDGLAGSCLSYLLRQKGIKYEI